MVAINILVAEDLLRRIRSVCEGPIILMKGIEVALRYPEPTLRPFGDLDLLVPNAPAVQSQLKRAGFEEVMDPSLFIDIHQEQPLQMAGSPLVVEIHKWPKWPDFLDGPRVEDLLEVAVASRTGVSGINALPDAHHAVIVAAHAWTHGPLNHARQLLDVAILAEGIPRQELRAIARQWGVDRVWQTTIRCVDNLFGDRMPGAAAMLWARHLRPLRERTVAETHLEKYLSPFWAYPWPMAVQVSLSMLRAELRPAVGETWAEKAARTRIALRNAFRARSDHDRELGLGAEKRRKKGRFTRTG